MNELPPFSWKQPLLSDQAPRKVRPVPLVLLWVIGLCVILMLVLTFGVNGALKSVGTLSTLRDKGAEVAGRVTALYVTSGKNSADYVEYTFRFADEDRNDKQAVAPALYNNLRVDGPVTVTVLPSDPSLHILGRVDDAVVRSKAVGWGIGLGLAVIISCGLLYAIRVTVSKQIAILSSYTATPAKIQTVGDVTGAFVTVRQVAYLYRDLRGGVAQKTDSVDSVVGKSLIGVEDTTALINPANEQDVRLLSTMNLVRRELDA